MRLVAAARWPMMDEERAGKTRRSAPNNRVLCDVNGKKKEGKLYYLPSSACFQSVSNFREGVALGTDAFVDRWLLGWRCAVISPSVLPSPQNQKNLWSTKGEMFVWDLRRRELELVGARTHRPVESSQKKNCHAIRS